MFAKIQNKIRNLITEWKEELELMKLIAPYSLAVSAVTILVMRIVETMFRRIVK